MKSACHILNGDMLKSQFPSSIQGELIVARECMVDGDVSGNTPEEVFTTRERFMSSAYPDITGQSYFNKTTPEFDKMKSIQDNSEVNLWFEDDLFCQVNLWFVIYFLQFYQVKATYFLVRPSAGLALGFGGMSQKELITAFQNRHLLTPESIDELCKFWPLYQGDQLDAMQKLALSLKSDFPFLIPAIHAHIQRIPTADFPGRPKQVLLDLMDELNTTSFGTIFRAFNAQESIYGFGDLQVKRLYDELMNTDQTTTPTSFS